MSSSLAEKLDKIRSPKLQNQRETAVVLHAVEETFKDQNLTPNPTAYFAALLALLGQAIPSSSGDINKDLATSVVYLLDLVAPHVPVPILRAKFAQILSHLAPALTNAEIEAPLLRSSTGCLESILIAQDAAAWALPQTQIGPRAAMAGLLTLAMDHRPKVRKRSQEALTKVLKNPPPSPSLDHPAADSCAETVLRSLSELAQAAGKKSNGRNRGNEEHQPGLIHALQLVKTVALASGGWPSKKIDSLCEVLLNISRSSSEYLTMAAFEIFEVIFAGMSDEISSSKLPRLMEVITELQPSQNDSQLLPPWIAVLSRGYDVSAQVDPDETFQKLPALFSMVSNFLGSMSHNIRISASECLISFLVNCVPDSAILEPSIYDEKILEKLAKEAVSLLTVKYQSAWMEVFNVLAAVFECFKWRSAPLLNEVVKTVGELRGTDSFNGKKEADTVLGNAIEAMGPDNVISILPLNLAKPKSGQPGRAWLLPILRDHTVNTSLSHFRSEFVPLGEMMFQRVLDHGDGEKTMEIKIFETLVQQIWALLPGYCNLPLDLTTAFDQTFAELLANLLYQKPELRPDICRALQMLVETNKEVNTADASDEKAILLRRVSRADAEKNIEHLAGLAGNLLAVLFNVYSQTLPQYRGYILQCINTYLSITPEAELDTTFERVTKILNDALVDSTSQTQADKQKEKKSENAMPPTSHTLMDLIITMSIYLPRSSYATLFSMTAQVLPQSSDPQLQKKAYKLLPRLETSPVGVLAIEERILELQQLILTSASSATAPCRHDRLAAISVVVSHLPPTSLHFIPSVLSEVVISAKETNKKAREAAFDLLVLMGRKMQGGGIINQSLIPNMPSDAPNAEANMEEFFTMVSAGLAGSTPHMISASITALARILYEFRSELPDKLLEDLVSTLDLFLASNNREIVQSVLGFVKVAIISLPENIIKPRLETMIPGLLGWSKEHKAKFGARVKHIFERMIRRFGFETIDRYCPEADKKFIQNIRKTKERNKRKKKASVTGADGEGDDYEGNTKATKHRNKFESEFERAVYGDSDSSSDSDVSDDSSTNKARQRSNGKGGGKQYIHEDPTGEPLDLLSSKALGHISTTKPITFKSQAEARAKAKSRTRAKTDPDGKLILGGPDSDDDGRDVNMLDGGEKSLEEGINAYVSAIKGRDAVQRGRGGRLKFTNKKSKGGGEEGDEMDLDEENTAKIVSAGRKENGGAAEKRGFGNGKGNGNVPVRKGLDGRKVSGGRVGKSFGGGGAKRGDSGGRGGRGRGAFRGGRR